MGVPPEADPRSARAQYVAILLSQQAVLCALCCLMSTGEAGRGLAKREKRLLGSHSPSGSARLRQVTRPWFHAANPLLMDP
jgi:hypothetical protein